MRRNLFLSVVAILSCSGCGTPLLPSPDWMAMMTPVNSTTTGTSWWVDFEQVTVRILVDGEFVLQPAMRIKGLYPIPAGQGSDRRGFHVKEAAIGAHLDEGHTNTHAACTSTYPHHNGDLCQLYVEDGLLRIDEVTIHLASAQLNGKYLVIDRYADVHWMEPQPAYVGVIETYRNPRRP